MSDYLSTIFPEPPPQSLTNDYFNYNNPFKNKTPHTNDDPHKNKNDYNPTSIYDGRIKNKLYDNKDVDCIL